MALGNTSEKRTYFSIGFGKIRQKTINGAKVDSSTPNAKAQKTQKGDESWAIEYDYISGLIEKIFFKESKEYGNSYEVVMRDGEDLYQISLGEDSKYWTSFARLLPNVIFSLPVTIYAYDFTTKEGNRKSGINILQDNNANTEVKEKKNGSKVYQVVSFYSKKNDEGIFEPANGYPSAEGIDFNDSMEAKEYYIKLCRFFRKEFKNRIEPKFTQEGFNTEMEKPVEKKTDYKKESALIEKKEYTPYDPNNDSLPF